MINLIILDRDGVINHDRDDFVKSVDEWQPISGSMDAIAFLTQAGYTIAVATNQSGIARGYFDVDTLNDMHAKMHKLVQQAGGLISGIWFCPHTNEHQCSCRKPKPGMILDILNRFRAKPEQTYVVGDSLRDLEAAQSAGCLPVLVKTGKGERTFTQSADKLPENTLIFDDLMAFSQFLLRQQNKLPSDKGSLKKST